jgi:ABC-type branched-subunit amino acid transport system permease subunit
MFILVLLFRPNGLFGDGCEDIRADHGYDGGARGGAADHRTNVVLNFAVMVLLIALVGQGWNLLGGYGGVYSFGHAAFFGTTRATAILQMRYGVNAWLGFGVGIAAGALVGGAAIMAH